MKIFVSGARGQLGSDVMACLRSRGHEAVGADLGIANGVHKTAGTEPEMADGVPESMEIDLDITDRGRVLKIIRDINPDAIIHCAAWTAVDKAEEPEEREKVFAVNVSGTRNLAEAALLTGAKMIYISSDYVFDGSGDRPWKPGDRTAPLNVYGRSKLEGEKAVMSLLSRYFIVRSSWLFGVHGNNFIRTMIRIGKTRDQVRVVNDQIGRPTFTRDLAVLLADLAESDKYGIYHASNEGTYVSRYDLCRVCYLLAGLKTKVIPVSTGEYGPVKAPRPYNSRLDTSGLGENGFSSLPDWRDAVGRYLAEAEWNGTDQG